MTTETTTKKKVLDPHEAAAYLSVSRTTLYRLVRTGLPHVRLGRSLRFRSADLDGYLEEKITRTWEPYEAKPQ